MEKTCDLHTHSYYSDGTYSPAQLVKAAGEAGLSGIVLSDHNTVAGLSEFVDAAKGTELEAVPGVEFTTEYQGIELHILAMYVLPENYEPIQNRLEQFILRKERSNRDLTEALTRAGYPVDYDAICKKAAGRINRAVIGEEMVRLGYCESVKEAFARWLSESRGYYIPAARPDALDTIRFIKSLGCTAVLAHPFLDLDEARLREFLPKAREAGLDGMEVYYARYDTQTTALAKAIAEEYGILESGGSDYHGTAKPDIALGTGKGNLHIPLSVLHKLKTRASNGGKAKAGSM